MSDMNLMDTPNCCTARKRTRLHNFWLGRTIWSTFSQDCVDILNRVPIGLKIPKRGVITAEPPYLAEVCEHPPQNIQIPAQCTWMPGRDQIGSKLMGDIFTVLNACTCCPILFLLSESIMRVQSILFSKST